MATISCSTVSQDFPTGTVPEQFVFSILGTLEDGTSFTDSVSSDTPSIDYTFKPGTFTATISRNGVTSVPSDPFSFSVPVSVTIAVPDPAQKAQITA